MSTMTDLFLTDPLDLTDENIDSMIDHYRANYKAYVSNPDAVKGKKAPAITANQRKALDLADKIDIDI